MAWQKKWSSKDHAAPVYSCCFDDKWIYSSAGDKFVTRWALETGEQDAFAVKLESPAYLVGSVSSHLLIIGCSNGAVIAIDTQTKMLAWERNFHGKALFSFADCPESRFFILGDAEGELMVISYSGDLVAGFPLNCGKIRVLRKYGDLLFCGSQDGAIRKFELPSFNEVQIIKAHEGSVNALVFFGSSHTLISGGRDAHLKMWDLVTGNELQSIPAHYQTIYGLEKCSEKELVSVSMDKTVKFWNISELKVNQRLEFKQGGHNRSVNGCITASENQVITFGDDRQIICWERVR